MRQPDLEKQPKKLTTMMPFFVPVLVAGLLTVGVSWGMEEGERNLSSTFPKHSATSDEGDILSDYPDYLNFVLEIGRQTDHQTAVSLERKYQELRRRDKHGAVRFLRGLRFEMLQKLEFLGASSNQVSTQTPVVRRWVSKFMREWLREADEYLFRSYSSALARRD